MIRQEAVLLLPAEADSVGRARRHVQRVLAALLSDDAAGRSPVLSPAEAEVVIADAQTCTSELVTNAVLHAGTDLAVGVAVIGDVVRLEVHDGSPVEPQWIPRSLTACTGRGLALITALSAVRGVDVQAGGKTVWCELSAAAGRGGLRADGGEEPALEAVHALLAAQWSSVVAELTRAEEDPPGPGGADDDSTPRAGPGQQGAPIRLLGYPLRRGVRMREHREAVLRELRILGLTRAIADPTLAALASSVGDLLSAEYAGHLTPAATRVLQALAAGGDSVDLDYARVQDHEHLVEQWSVGIAHLEDLSTDTGLATLATPDDVRELQRWVLEEFDAQLHGRTPQPWAGGLD